MLFTMFAAYAPQVMPLWRQIQRIMLAHMRVLDRLTRFSAAQPSPRRIRAAALMIQAHLLLLDDLIACEHTPHQPKLLALVGQADQLRAQMEDLSAVLAAHASREVG